MSGFFLRLEEDVAAFFAAGVFLEGVLLATAMRFLLRTQESRRFESEALNSATRYWSYRVDHVNA